MPPETIINESFIKGDLIDKNDTLFINELNKINCNLKYAVSGKSDLNNKDIFKEINFKLLDNTYEYIYSADNKRIMISGISSNYDNIDINKKLEDIYKKEHEYSILIMHDSNNIDKIDLSKFNLILTGNNHGGEVNLPIFGNTYKEEYNSKYINREYKINNTLIYTSNGIGSSKGFRLFNTPSINFFRLK